MAVVSFPHGQVRTSQFGNPVFVGPTFYPFALFGSHIPSFIDYDAICMMGKDHVGSFQEKRFVKPFQGIGPVYVN